MPTALVEAAVSNILRDAENLERLLAARAAHSVFQPIVQLASGANEPLGCGRDGRVAACLRALTVHEGPSRECAETDH